MKVYIMTDLEGVSGVCSDEYMDRSLPYYQDARRYLMGDLNAAVAGAFDGGAAEVWVRDGHFNGNNFITDMLDPRAEHEKTFFAGWSGTLDETFDVSFFIGAHAMAGTRNAFLDHTQSSKSIFKFSINGRTMGELGQWGVGCGGYDIPVALVTGDEAAIIEANEFFPGCQTVAVKQAVCRNRARIYPVAKVQEQIRLAAAEAVRNADKVAPLKVDPPYVCEQTYYRTDIADTAEARGYERIGPRTCRKTVEKPTDVVM